MAIAKSVPGPMTTNAFPTKLRGAKPLSTTGQVYNAAHAHNAAMARQAVRVPRLANLQGVSMPGRSRNRMK